MPTPARACLRADLPITAPSPPADALLAMSPPQQRSLAEIHALLHRLHSRNHSQHRRSHWFKSLASFRKQLGLLLAELASADAEDAADADQRHQRERLETRLALWDRGLVHQWYLHFTQLVAANQFAVLGLVLMAAAARVCKLVGITAFYEDIGSDDMRLVLQTIDDGVVVDVFGNMDTDEGVVVKRDEGEDDGDFDLDDD